VGVMLVEAGVDEVRHLEKQKKDDETKYLSNRNSISKLSRNDKIRFIPLSAPRSSHLLAR
jgi:hypothetical protein